MEFRKYQHLQRYGTTEVQNIEIGTTYIFPKIDGTNASVWLDKNGEIQAGSRKRHLTIDDDNGGFYAWVKKQKNILEYLKENPNHRLFGEWLIPHSLKTYKDDSWRNFYIFDVAVDKSETEITHNAEDKVKYLPYKKYKHLLENKGLSFIPLMAKITNPTYEQLIEQLAKNTFLIDENKGIGEGIVIKNYEFKNRFGRNSFAKIINSEFKEKSPNLSSVLKDKKVEKDIAKEFVTTALVEKVYAKIDNDGGFNNKKIPQLLNTVYYDIVREDIWNILKKYKSPSINFKTLQKCIFKEIRHKISDKTTSS